MTESNLPRDLAMLSDFVNTQDESFRDLFQYATVMLLVEDGKAESIERKQTAGPRVDHSTDGHS